MSRATRLFCALAFLLVPSAAAALPDLSAEIFGIAIEENGVVNPGDVVEGCAGARTGRRLLHFSLRSRNLGPDDLIMGNPGCPNCSANPGAVCANPNYICSEAHGHPHFEGFAGAELLDVSGVLIATGHKQGFCFLDLECANPVYTCGYQGISVGCSDIYSAGLPCQYIDITDVAVPDGDYILRVTVDEGGLIDEANENNNVASTALHIGDVEPPICSAYTAADQSTAILALEAETAGQPDLAPRSSPVCAACGNGTRDAGEVCDDGNTDDGDCCSSDCQAAASDGISCTNPGQCTIEGTCFSGECSGGKVECDPCLSCQPPLGCQPPANLLCDAMAGSASIATLVDRPTNPDGDTLSWRFTSGSPIALLDFGSPTTATDLTLCVFDHNGLKLSSTIPAGGLCHGRPCWQERNGVLGYSDPDLSPDGVRSLQLKPGAAGQAEILLRGQGPNLALSDLGLEAPVTVRLKRAGGPACWQARFPAAQRNTSLVYKARINN